MLQVTNDTEFSNRVTVLLEYLDLAFAEGSDTSESVRDFQISTVISDFQVDFCLFLPTQALVYVKHLRFTEKYRS